MNENFTAIIIAVIGAMSGIAAYISQHRKGKAEAAQIITEIATSLITPLRDEIADLRAKLETLRLENELLRIWAKNLVIQIVQLGGVPCEEPTILERNKKVEKEKT